MASKYSKASGAKVAKVMHERKAGTLKSGSTGKKVTSKKQAVAIGLSDVKEKRTREKVLVRLSAVKLLMRTATTARGGQIW